MNYFKLHLGSILEEWLITGNLRDFAFFNLGILDYNILGLFYYFSPVQKIRALLSILGY